MPPEARTAVILIPLLNVELTVAPNYEGSTRDEIHDPCSPMLAAYLQSYSPPTPSTNLEEKVTLVEYVLSCSRSFMIALTECKVGANPERRPMETVQSHLLRTCRRTDGTPLSGAKAQAVLAMNLRGDSVAVSTAPLTPSLSRLDLGMNWVIPLYYCGPDPILHCS